MPNSKRLPAFPPASARRQRGSTGSRQRDSTGPKKRILVGSMPPGLPGSTKPSPTAPAVSPPAGSRPWDSTGPKKRILVGSMPPGLPGSTKPSPTAPVVSPPAGSRQWDSTRPGMARGRSHPLRLFPACCSGNAIRWLRPRQPQHAARRRFRSHGTKPGPRMLGSSLQGQRHPCGTESHRPPDRFGRYDPSLFPPKTHRDES